MSRVAVKTQYGPVKCHLSENVDVRHGKRVNFHREAFHKASTSHFQINLCKQHTWTRAFFRRVEDRATSRCALDRKLLKTRIRCKGTERDEQVREEDSLELSLEDIVKEVVASKFEENAERQEKGDIKRSDGLQIDVAPKVLEALKGTGELQGKSLFDLVEEKRKQKLAEELRREENPLKTRSKSPSSRLRRSGWVDERKDKGKRKENKAVSLDTVYVEDPPLHSTLSMLKEWLQSDPIDEYNGQAWGLRKPEVLEDTLDEAFVAAYTIPWVLDSSTGVCGQNLRTLPTPIAEQILDFVVIEGKRTIRGRDLEARGLASRPKLLDTGQLKQEVFRSGPFHPQFFVKWERGGWVVLGDLEGDPAEARQRLQARLDQHFPEYNQVVLLLSTPQGVPWCLILSADEPIHMDLLLGVPAVFASAALSALSMWYCKSMAAADPMLDNVDAAIALAALPLGLLAILFSGSIARSAVASFYGVQNRFPLPFPVPGLGAIGMSAPLRGVLPTRAALVDIPLAGSLATAAASIAMITSSHPWLAQLFPEQGPLILVPPETLQHSHALSFLVAQLQEASIVGPDNAIFMAIHPLAFAGLLGLNATALSLLPIGISDGGRIAQGLLGREWHQTASNATFFLILVGLVFGDTSLCFWLLVFNSADVAGNEWYQKDEVSKVGFLRALIASVTMAMGVVVLSPTFSWVPFHSLPKGAMSVQSLLPTWGHL